VVNSALFSSKTCEWGTPQTFYDRLNAEFGFTLDPCATAENRKCGKFYTKAEDGLLQDWGGEVVFCNPPYGHDIGLWCKKCYEQSQKGVTVVMLVPARTDTAWFHDWVYGKAEWRFVRGRLKFEGGDSNAPFPSLGVVYK
jgi:site-specific DNA-methyltransferase (adenine-specific)